MKVQKRAPKNISSTPESWNIIMKMKNNIKNMTKNAIIKYTNFQPIPALLLVLDIFTLLPSRLSAQHTTPLRHPNTTSAHDYPHSR
jgi:hypothetical protein